MYNIAPKKRKNTKIIIYAIIIVALIILWFICASKVKSLNNKYQQDSNKLSTEIIDNFSKKLSKSQDDAITLGILGENLINKGFTKYGLIALDQAIEKNSQIRDLTLYTAQENFDANNIEKAKNLAITASQIDPLYSPTFTLLGTIYESLGDTQNAQICYNKAKDFQR